MGKSRIKFSGPDAQYFRAEYEGKTAQPLTLKYLVNVAGRYVVATLELIVHANAVGWLLRHTDP